MRCIEPIFTMHLRKTLPFLIAGIVIFAACKKESSQTNPDDCTVQRTTRDGSIIEGQYIIAFKPSAIDSRSMSTENIKQINDDVLSRNQIASSALQGNFTGEPGGFVAKLSEEEVVRLQQDNAIAAIEPDRIIALSTCFTVAEPRLITWNIQRVGYGNGIGKTAWIIDTGIDFEHPDLTVDKTRSKSFISGVVSADDENGHGTHVAGIIGAKNNSF